MNHKSITPNPQQPVDRVPTGQLPSALAELSEATLSSSSSQVQGSSACFGCGMDMFGNKCSYDGDDE